MLGSMHRNWGTLMRRVTVTAAILAIVFSALGLSPELDHSAPLTQHAVALETDLGLANGGHAASSAEADCHIGYSCTLVVLPSHDLALPRFHRASEFFLLAGYLPSVVAHIPYHPPRTLSLV